MHNVEVSCVSTTVLVGVIGALMHARFISNTGALKQERAWCEGWNFTANELGNCDRVCGCHVGSNYSWW